MSEPAAKKQKFQNKKGLYQSNRKQYLEVGQKGFLATCNFNEKDCVRECYNLLNQYANELYGPEEPAVQDLIKEASNEEQLSNDIADELQKQIDDSNQKAKTLNKRRFQVVDTGAKNVVFIKTSLDNPVNIAEHIVKDIFESKKQKTRYLLRLVPIEVVCKANHKDIVDICGQLCDKYFLKEPSTFSIVYNKRFNGNICRDEILHDLANLIKAKNTQNKVDLKHAKKSLIVEVVKGLCCLSVVENYMAMKKYNLNELAKHNTENIKEDQEQKVEHTEKLDAVNDNDNKDEPMDKNTTLIENNA